MKSLIETESWLKTQTVYSDELIRSFSLVKPENTTEGSFTIKPPIYQEESEIKMGGSDGVFPQVRKTEHVVPLHQDGDRWIDRG